MESRCKRNGSGFPVPRFPVQGSRLLGFCGASGSKKGPSDELWGVIAAEPLCSPTPSFNPEPATGNPDP
jgi:hypothetical protein